MDLEKIKNDMMELWKTTFHDSKRYIELVFDAYFNADNAFTVYDGEKLIAALLGVEYEFWYVANNGKRQRFEGMYLCGLATLPEYRRQGIMAKLMERAEAAAQSRGFEISFLIPANFHLREYYRNKGYITSSFKRFQTVKWMKSATRDEMNIYTFKDFFDREKYGFIYEVASWCRDREKPGREFVTLRHTVKDFITILSENENSFFLTDDSFDPEYPILAKVRAVVFPADIDYDAKCWSIVGIYLSDSSTNFCIDQLDYIISDNILNSIMSLHPGFDIKFNLPTVNLKLKEDGELESYAMVKILSDDKICRDILNQHFKISLMLD